MLRFTIRRLVMFIPMVFLFSVISFTIIQAPPGDFLTDYAAFLSQQGEQVSETQLRQLRSRYGLDQPIYVQYGRWMWGVLQWDFGMSLEWRRPVSEMINQRLLLTVTLATFTILFTWILALPIGIISAVKQYSVIDYAVTFVSYIGVGTPNFLLALLIMYTAFSVFDLRVMGLFSSEYIDAPWSVARIIDLMKHIWVPMLILGTDGTARFTRIVRANVLDELHKPYVQAARSKGLSETKVILKYPSRIALNPFISTAGWALPQLFSGSLIVAVVMALPTIGPLLLNALMAQDMYMAGSILLILMCLTLIGTLISDLMLAWLDPRIRMGA